ncbi:3-ketoacyl-CoA synthase 4-like [Phragmites australis]|uniref:3-ketoacyl-CoA synthase 4-like n=1 Tax=Phragmites australis TaxID=29695 RepID=UPI002D789403|nr:3-ketoacyl-CoA synthase 4-like [Phragmites australis]
MDVAHRDHLLVAARRALGVATLLLCLLGELLVFALRRHAALYLVPVCVMLLLWRFNRRAATADIGLVDFACLRPPRRLRIPIPGLLEHLRLIGCFDEESVKFMSRVIEACGMGDETYFPPSLHYIPPSATHADAMDEARAMFLSTLDALFARTGVPPYAVGALVVNCSGFCPAPSLAAVIAGHYRMRADVRTFNLSGMGCAAGVVGVDVAQGVLRAHAIRYAVVVSAEIVTVGWYSGRDRCKLLLNCFFRTGCAAALLSNTGSVSMLPKYRLVTLTRTNRTADDRSYVSAVREEDGEGITGFSIGRGLGGVARDLLRAHLLALGPAILPWREKLSYATALLLFQRYQRSKKLADGDGNADIPKPNFLTAASHFCLPSSGKPMIRRLAEGLGLGEREAEAALMTFHRFGNQSAASLWYQLAYHEAKGRVLRGDRVWQLGMGSGPKANSAVWERVRGDPNPAAADESPWADCIHRFPVGEP